MQNAECKNGRKLLIDDERHRLGALLHEGMEKLSNGGKDVIEILDWADYLLKNGVTVQPCRIGEPVYFIFFDDELGIYDIEETEIKDICSRGIFVSMLLGKEGNNPEHWRLMNFGYEDMFFTKEEAEKAISEKDLEGI